MQTQTKFTPGPWQLDRAGVNVQDSTSEHYTVAHCHGNSVANVEANAQLISLAPEMLDALQRIADICAGDLRESLHGEAQTKFDFEAQLRTVRGHAIGLSAIANSILSKLNS